MRSSGCSRFFLLAILPVATTWIAAGQQFRGFQAASVVPPSPVVLKPAEEVVVPVQVRVRSGYHVNSDQPREDYLIPTQLSWDPSKLKLKQIEYPEAETVTYDFSEKPLSVYSGEFEIRTTFEIPKEIPSDLTELTGEFRYQACDNRACYPPKTITIRVPLEKQ